MPSARYLAEHVLMPRFLTDRGADAVFAAVAREDSDFFIPVWAEAGFRFSPRVMGGVQDGLRVGLLTLPTPREATEAYLAVVIGRVSEPGKLRYFLWETSDPHPDGRSRTMIGEWEGGRHLNHGEGPAFTGDLDEDGFQFLKQVAGILGIGPAAGRSNSALA